MTILQDSWSNFSKDVAQQYLKTFGAPSAESKRILTDVLAHYQVKKCAPLTLIELGCGNAQLAEYFLERNLRFEYTGVDFSKPLLDAAREEFKDRPAITLLEDDVHELQRVTARYDFAVYSHVLEVLSSPEMSLKNAKRVAERIVIRFYEPPVADVTTVDLRNLDVGNPDAPPQPYIRWTMGKDFYRLILSNLGVKRVDIYRSSAKDQIHVLHFD